MDTTSTSDIMDNGGSSRASEAIKLLPSPSIITTSTPDQELPQLLANSHISATRPLASRSFTDPSSPSSSSSPSSFSSSPSTNMKMATLALRPRNTSPYSRPHLRSKSTTSSLSAPPITRSHSSPMVESLGSSPFNRSTSPSPHHSTPRKSSPLRRPLEDSYSFSGIDIDQTISENSELDITPRQISTANAVLEDSLSTPNTPSSPFSVHGTFPRSTRRRPASPLHTLGNSFNQGNKLHTSSSSPALRSPTPTSPASIKFNESFPSSAYASSMSAFSSGSSMPSTPTSFRSRSPSISSLETIPDSPDAEREAAEQTDKEMRERDVDSKIKAEADKEVRGRGRFRDGRSGSERKRWSVCGAERRADLDVIWED